MSARGCAAATCGEPITKTIDVANGTNRRGMAEPSARSSIAAMAIAAPVAPATTATMRRVPGVVSDKAANAARDFIRVTPKEKGGGPQGAAAR
jgi:hypothetical protein